MGIRTLNTNPRPTSEAEKAWVAAQPFWYVPQFPLYEVPPRRRGRKRNIHQPWFRRMVDDIDTSGLRSPILLNYSDTEHPDNPFPARENFCVNAGNHRVMAANLLGWDTIPALVWGMQPMWICSGPLTLEAANERVKDGRIALSWHGPILVGARDAREEFSGE